MNTLFLFPGDVVDGEGHTGVGRIDDDVDLVDVEPLAGDVGADIRLVLVVGRAISTFSFGAAAEILDGHASPPRRAGAARSV